MKKLTYILLALLAFAAASCGSGAADKSGGADSTSVGGAKLGDAFETSINIRYVSLDTIYAHYRLAQQVDSAINADLLAAQKQTSQYENQINSMRSKIEQNVQQNSYLTQQSYEKDVQDLQNMGNSLSQKAQQIELQTRNRAASLTNVVNDSIRNFITDYNKDKKYDAILYYSPVVGMGSALYMNPKLVITNEILNGLNARYGSKANVAAKK
ncbi:MAG: OmpH family outer membrane protein [Lachnospiraceae bacterium]|nr:OmpH family outer membrane protein [Lachnospiraceae bacterium]